MSAIESALTTQLGLMATGEIQEIFFTTTASGISVFNVWSGYVGTIYKTDTNRGVVSIIPHGTEPKTINGFYVNSAWTWESLYDIFDGCKMKALNFGTGENPSITYTMFAVLIIGRPSANTGELVLFGPSGAFVIAGSDTYVTWTLSNSNKTITLSNSTDTFRQGVFIYK